MGKKNMSMVKRKRKKKRVDKRRIPKPGIPYAVAVRTQQPPTKPCEGLIEI